MAIVLTITLIREDVNSPWPISIAESEFKDYLNETYILPGRMTEYKGILSEDGLTKTVKREFSDNESLLAFRTDPNLASIKKLREQQMIENNVLLFSTVEYTDD